MRHLIMRKRNAFTLVEMMVSMALTIFIMVLLSQAFVAAMQTFRALKGIGDMEEKLRTAVAIMRRDLTAQHFVPNKSISDSHFYDKNPPDQGYLRIAQGSPVVRRSGVNPNPINFFEETDGDGIPSARVVDASLATTMWLHGNSRQNTLTTNISSDPSAPSGLTTSTNAYQTTGTYVGQWAEVAYYLKFSESVPNGPNLYALCRRQLLAVPNSDAVNATTPGVAKLTSTNAYAEISCKPDPNPTYANVRFNSAADLTIPQRRFGMNPLTGSPFDSTVNNFGGDGGAFLPAPTITGYSASPFNLLRSGYPSFSDINYLTNSTAPGLYSPAISYGSLAGGEILVNDVISFEIKLLIDDTNAKSGNRTNLGTLPPLDPYVDLFDSMVYLLPYANPANPVQPLDKLKSPNPRFDFTLAQMPNPETNGLTNMPRYDGGKPCVYDTWSYLNDGTYDYSGWRPSATASSNNSRTLPLSCPIIALQITLRIWDKNTQQTRQMTFVQPM